MCAAIVWRCCPVPLFGQVERMSELQRDDIICCWSRSILTRGELQHYGRLTSSVRAIPRAQSPNIIMPG